MLLFLSDVSGSEVLVILLVILIFFGPKSIPGIAKTFGKTIYQIKQASDDLKAEITKSGMDIKKDMNLDGIFRGAENNIQDEILKPIEKEVNEVDKSLNSISYEKNYVPAKAEEVVVEKLNEQIPQSEATLEISKEENK
jgi:sec-independent protein translocase protein TatA